MSKKLNVSQEDLLDLNPELKNGLKEGMVLNVPSRRIIRDTILSIKPKVDLLKTVDKTKQKELVLFLPFNINKIENDSLKTKAEHLKTNKFLNLTLDFYNISRFSLNNYRLLIHKTENIFNFVTKLKP
mgnify:CR=1 FL=1